MKNRTILFVCILAIAASGCTSAKISRALASGQIGCPTNEIEIKNEDVTSGVHTFTAACRGTDHFCTYVYPSGATCKAQK